MTALLDTACKNRQPLNLAHRILRLALLAVLTGLSMSAVATTDAEDRMYKSPMPHEALGTSGARVQVHWVSMPGYLEGRPDNATQISNLKMNVQACIQEKRDVGAPVNPPRVWPDFISGQRIDTYSSVNRTINYVSSLIYGINVVDCSLMEIQGHVASLSSSKGICSIDLVAKTAHGVCDAGAHASARPPAHAPAPSAAELAKIERDSASNPAVAALAKAMRDHPPAGTGERKVIVGLDCDVWKNPFDPDGTICISRGGSFIAAQAGGGATQSGLVLEITSVAGLKSRAVGAQLDAMVSAAVFSPYLAAGFRISGSGAHK